MQKRISIIIPAYNEARTLSGCLDAIAAQTLQPDEVIVVDNNSSDETVAVTQQYPFVRVVKEARQGIVYARNAGFTAASGDLLARIDADTRLPEDWVARVRAFYARPGRAGTVLTGGCHFYNLRGGRLAGRTYDLLVHRLNRVLLGAYFPWGSNSVIPATAWRTIRNSVLTYTDIHEDLDLGVHLKRAGVQVVYTPNLRVATMARRILEDHGKLWPYLTWWPRTYRANQMVVWPLVWPLVVLVWLGSFTVIANEYVLRLLLRVPASPK